MRVAFHSDFFNSPPATIPRKSTPSDRKLGIYLQGCLEREWPARPSKARACSKPTNLLVMVEDEQSFYGTRHSALDRWCSVRTGRPFWSRCRKRRQNRSRGCESGHFDKRSHGPRGGAGHPAGLLEPRSVPAARL